MSTFTNTAREVEMPNGDVVVIHNAPTGGENTTSNIKKFKYDDNGHVTESTAADAEDLNLSGYSTPTTGNTDIGTSDDVQTAIGKLDHQSHIDQTNILYALKTGANNLSPVDNVIFTMPAGAAYTDPISINLESGDYVIRYKLTSTADAAVAITYDGSEHVFYDSDSPYSDTVITHNFTVVNSGTSFRFYFNQAATVSELMIVSKEVWDTVGHDFMPPALPNYDLTVREAEDRAALAEQVDEGNKNLIRVDLDCIISANGNLTWNENVGTTSDGHTTFTVNQTDGTIRVQSDGSNAQSQFIIIGDSISPYFTIGERYVISGCPSGGSTTKYDLRAWYGSVYYTDWGDSSVFTCSVTRLKVDIVIRANQTLDLTFKPMICKEIDWNVSNKLMPGELIGGLKPVYRNNSSTVSKTFSYTILRDDFITDGICNTSCGTYIVSVINWSATPLFSLYAISFSGGNTSYVNVTKIAGENLTITVTESTFSFNTTGTVRIYALV